MLGVKKLGHTTTTTMTTTSVAVAVAAAAVNAFKRIFLPLCFLLFQIEFKVKRQSDIQTYRQTNKQSNNQTIKQSNKQTDIPPIIDNEIITRRE